MPTHDPALRGRLTAAVLALAVLWPLLQAADFSPARLFDAGTLDVTLRFLATFLPLAHDAAFLRLLGHAVVETLAMATAGVALAWLLAVPLALVTTRSLSISRLGPGPRRWPGYALRGAARAVLVLLRGIPELVWALVFVRLFGLGPAAAVLALTLTYGGMLGKVYAEILDSTETRPARVLLESGGGRLTALAYGLLPGAVQELVSYTVYRWECGIRASVVMGFVGAGGLGQLMDQSVKLLNGGEAAAILLCFLVLVVLADLVSGGLRRLVSA